jgi:predicted HicB family RNase H-like nuclease
MPSLKPIKHYRISRTSSGCCPAGIAFDGLSVDELEASFFAAVDEYLNDCDRLGKDPDKPFSGRFNLRIPPELHRQAVIVAEKEGVSLNAFVEKTLAQSISRRR